LWFCSADEKHRRRAPTQTPLTGRRRACERCDPARRAVARVAESLRFTAAGGEHEVQHPGAGLQKCSSYIAGLTALPYHDGRSRFTASPECFRPLFALLRAMPPSSTRS
jgi:hypothetical protein